MTILFKLFFYSTKAFELRLKIFFFGLYNIIWYPKDIKSLVKKTLQNNHNNQDNQNNQNNIIGEKFVKACNSKKKKLLYKIII